MKSPFASLPLPLKMHHPQLARFAWLMLLLMLPTALLLFWDERTWREVAIWAKPLKFMASTALFAATAAWLIGLLPPTVRQSRQVQALAWTLMATAAFEVGYISLQAALGEGSHYNITDPLHAALYGLMAIAATVLAATQAWLAWLITRHSASRQTPFTQAVAVGLLLTFVLTTVSGFLMGDPVRPTPIGMGLPIVGWHFDGGDFRPAHFLGVHAQQLLPLFGWALQQSDIGNNGNGRLWLLAIAAAYVSGWLVLVFNATATNF